MEVGKFEQMRHLELILVVENVVNCAIKVSHVVSEFRHCLCTCQCLICCHSARLQVIIVVGALKLANNRVHES